MESIKNYSRQISDFAILIIIFLLTFQKFEPLFGSGLDKSYIWALNWLFANDYNTLLNLNYPIGPLGFLKIPTVEGNNFLIAFWFYAFVKMSFIAVLLKLDSFVNGKRKLFSVFLILIISYFADIDFSIIGITFVLTFLSIKTQNIVSYSFAVLFASLGLFIKSSIGISALSIVFVSPIIGFYSFKDKKHLLKQVLAALLIFVLVGMLVFKNVQLFIEFLYSIIRLSASYSESLSLHPENNWIILLVVIVAIALIPILNKNKNVTLAIFLLLFPLFAVWKHSMSREDFHHYYKLIYFLIVFISALIIISENKNKYLLFVLPLSVMLLYLNMNNLSDYRSLKLEISGIINFIEPLANNNKFEKKYRNISENNIRKNKVNAETKDIIGGSNIDVYPWDLSYVAANSFNWRNRKTLELGASTSKWASSIAAQSYSKNNNSPEFVLFHLIKTKYQAWFGSLDGRYILNDEPLLIYNLLNNYSIVRKEEKFLLFEKNKNQNFFEPKLEKAQKIEFGEWLDIPDFKDEIIRLKVKSHKTFAGGLKTFLFKGEEYFIDYLFEDGKILTFRYVPATAVDGLWCRPFIQNPYSDVIEQNAVKVRLRNSNSLFVSKNIKITFERIKVKPTNKYSAETDYANALFSKFQENNTQTILNKNIGFEEFDSSKNKKYNIVENYAFSGNKSQKIKGGKLSFSFKYPIDSLWTLVSDSTLNIEIQTDLRYLNPNSSATIVVSLTTENENFWFSRALANNKNEESWEYLFFNKTFVREEQNNGILKIYVWNTGSEDIFIDNFRISVTAKN